MKIVPIFALQSKKIKGLKKLKVLIIRYLL